jgi:UDP-N-acetylglucosamine transferase subunit ALG13
MALDLGKIPIVVPRSSARGEHVDDHQRWYVRRLVEAREVVSVEEPFELLSTIDSFEELVRGLKPPTRHDPGPAIQRVIEVVSDLES